MLGVPEPHNSVKFEISIIIIIIIVVCYRGIYNLIYYWTESALN